MTQRFLSSATIQSKDKILYIDDIFVAISFRASSFSELRNRCGDRVDVPIWNIKYGHVTSGTYHLDEYGDAVKPIIIKTIRDGKFVVWEG